MKRHRTYLFALFIVLFLSLLHIWKRNRNSPPPLEFAKQSSHTDSIRHSDIRDTDSRPHREKSNQNASPRAPLSDLGSYKNKWIALRAENYGLIGEAHRQLAEETAEQLSCSSDAIALIQFLNNNNARIYGSLVEEAVGDLLREPDLHEARESLLRLAKDRENNRPEDGSLVEHWLLDFGKGCSQEEGSRIIAQLGAPEFKQQVLLGMLLNRVERDPITAVEGAYEQLRQGILSSDSFTFLEMLMSAIPADSDFELIEQTIPSDASEASRLGQVQLFVRWAKEAPADAINYIIDEPQRFQGSQQVGIITAAVARADYQVGLNWLDSFPKGDSYDQAVVGVIPIVAPLDPNLIKPYVDQIGDEATRMRSIELLRSNFGLDQ